MLWALLVCLAPLNFSGISAFTLPQRMYVQQRSWCVIFNPQRTCKARCMNRCSMTWFSDFQISCNAICNKLLLFCFFSLQFWGFQNITNMDVRQIMFLKSHFWTSHWANAMYKTKIFHCSQYYQMKNLNSIHKC